MGTFGNAVLGLVFLALAVANTLLMFKLWGYPFDHEKLKSSAPPRLMFLHRATGYAFLLIYLFMMWQMLPRLWNYQVELPPRTVAHLTLGMAIGVVLAIKIAIVRFFKHLESTMVPFLGTILLVCAALLIGISVPIALKETILSRQAVGGTAFSDQNVERVRRLLASGQVSASFPVQKATSKFGLEQGRTVLLTKCVQCHDLRTVLSRPRTPNTWVQTVERMAERSLFDPITPEEQSYVSAYLVAITPDLQRSVEQKREQEGVIVQAKMTLSRAEPVRARATARPALSIAEAQKVFETTCSGCHSPTKVEKYPPGSEKETRELIAKMMDEGLDASDEDIEKIIFYLWTTYVQ